MENIFQPNHQVRVSQKNQPMKTPAILTSTAIALSLSGCIDPSILMDQSYSPSDVGTSEQPRESTPSSGSALGSWAGSVTYTAVNGQSFASGIQIHVKRSSVTSAVSGSSAETVEARWNGNAVSWASFGSTMVTEWTIVPVSSRNAKVTSRVTRNGATLARGAGTLVRQ